jgi:transaldolase
MNPNTRQFADHRQSIWLDSISRGLLQSGTLAHYITDLGITGLTSNPTTFEAAIGTSGAYDASIQVLDDAGLSGARVLFELALEDLSAAADLLRPSYEASSGIDGWVSLAVSPLLAGDTKRTVQAAANMHRRAAKANLFIEIPGTAAGIAALEEAIFQGIPVNVTLLFSREHYLAAAQAYMRGIERRLAAGLDPKVESVASQSVSRWDVAMQRQLKLPLHNRLGIAIAMRSFKAYCELLESDRWRCLAAAGARPQRLLWASTGTKNSSAPDTLYVAALAGAGTIDAMPEATLLAFADHGEIKRSMPTDAGYAEPVLGKFRQEGVDDSALAEQLQSEGVTAFVKSWHGLLCCIQAKCHRSSLHASA